MPQRALRTGAPMSSAKPMTSVSRRPPAGHASAGSLSLVLLFLTPITAVTAGVVTVGQVPPHAISSGMLGIVGVLAVISGARDASRVTLPVLTFALAWLTVTAIHLGIGGVPLSNEVTISLSGIAILLGVANLRPDLRAVRAFLSGWTAAYMLAVMAAVGEKFFGYLPKNNYLVYQGGRLLEDVGLSSFFGNPNGFALFLVASCAIFMLAALTASATRVRFWFYVLQVSTVVAVFETNSRIGVSLVLIIVAVTLWIALSSHPRARLLVIVLAVASVAPQFISGGDQLVEGLQESTLLSVLSGQDGSFMVRFNLFLNGLAFTMDHPLIGVGPNMFEENMLVARDSLPTGNIINPHNGAIELLSQYGVPVFVVMMLVLVRAWKSARSRMRSAESLTEKTYVLGLTQLVLLLALPFASTMQSTFLGNPTAWLYLSAIVALAHLSSGVDPAPDRPTASRRATRKR